MFSWSWRCTSESWKQIISDLTGIAVVESKGSEFAAKGSVMGLGVTLNLFDSFKAAVEKMCHSVEIYQPNIKNKSIYNKYYTLFLNMNHCFMNISK